MTDEENKDLKNQEEVPQNQETTTEEENASPQIEENETVTETEETPDEDFTLVRSEEEDDDDWWKDEDEYSSSERESLAQMYSSTLKEFNSNEIVNATVVGIGEKEVILNIGFKSEGVVPVSEFRDMEDFAVGKEVEVFIESVEDAHGQLILSRKRAKSLRSWEQINASMTDDVILNGTVMRRTKGGFVVDINGIEAFLPGSQIDVKPVRDFDAYVNRQMEFKVVKINHAYENVVVSHKVLIEEKLEEQRKLILQNLEKGQVLEGMVKNMTNFGVFIDLGGVDGLLHITDISWGRINHPEEVLELDQTVQVVVLDFDDAKKRISLGMKQLTAHPWESLPEEIQQGSTVKGKIVTVADYGVFLEVMPGVEGLVHTSEMSWSQHIKNPGDTYKEGDILEAVVLSIDREERKMSLGLKQLKEDPWEKIQEKYPQGSHHKGLVRNMANYGLFVELEEGVDGLLHISDLSWTKKFNHPSEYVKVGEDLEVVVLEIDKDNRRLSLGHKQLTEDVWQTFASIFTVGSHHKGSIKKIDGKGAIVELEYGVEGSVPSRHLKVEEGKPDLKVDDVVDFVVIDFNQDAKRLHLSHTNFWKAPAPGDTPSSGGGAPKKSKKRSSGGGGQKAKSGTSLGDMDVLAQLKKQMEAEEKKSSQPKKKAAPKKEEAPAPEAEEVAEAPAEEVKAEAPAEEVKAEAPAEETPAEAPAEETPAEAPAEEAPAEEEKSEE